MKLFEITEDEFIKTMLMKLLKSRPMKEYEIFEAINKLKQMWIDSIMLNLLAEDKVNVVYRNKELYFSLVSKK